MEGMQAGVGAVIASVTYEMGAGIVQDKNGISTVIMVGAFIASCIFEVNVVYVVIVCGLIGVIRTCIAKRRKINDLSAIVLSFYRLVYSVLAADMRQCHWFRGRWLQHMGGSACLNLQILSPFPR